MPIEAVTDASVLIALDDIDLLDRFAPLFLSLSVPSAVAREVAPTVSLPPWCSVLTVHTPIPDVIVQAQLGQGESEALALSLELDRRVVLLDERKARQLAFSLDIPVLGTGGLIVRAKREGVIELVRPHLTALIATGFFVSPHVIDFALKQAGED